MHGFSYPLSVLNNERFLHGLSYLRRTLVSPVHGLLMTKSSVNLKIEPRSCTAVCLANPGGLSKTNFLKMRIRLLNKLKGQQGRLGCAIRPKGVARSDNLSVHADLSVFVANAYCTNGDSEEGRFYRRKMCSERHEFIVLFRNSKNGIAFRFYLKGSKVEHVPRSSHQKGLAPVGRITFFYAKYATNMSHSTGVAFDALTRPGMDDAGRRTPSTTTDGGSRLERSVLCAFYAQAQPSQAQWIAVDLERCGDMLQVPMIFTFKKIMARTSVIVPCKNVDPQTPLAWDSNRARQF
ncbi:hypothetical protein F5I97DRAFT_1829673 [Phlebopus sp. FC_14]|nr:hypothetical protein F5I97DRAFT_1829673 [Phlebopus sp. FC_14]